MIIFKSGSKALNMPSTMLPKPLKMTIHTIAIVATAMPITDINKITLMAL